MFSTNNLLITKGARGIGLAFSLTLLASCGGGGETLDGLDSENDGTPSVTATPTSEPTLTPTVEPSAPGITPTATPVVSPTMIDPGTPTDTPVPTDQPTQEPTSTPTPTDPPVVTTPTPTQPPAATPTAAVTPTPTIAPTATVTPTATLTPTATAAPTATPTPTPTDEPGFGGDMAKGRELMADAMCSSCHTDNGDGTFGRFEFKMSELKYPSKTTYTADSVEDLSLYIAETMPTTGVEKCVDDCADDIAAYLWSYIAPQATPTPTMAPTATAAPTATPTMTPTSTPTGEPGNGNGSAPGELKFAINAGGSSSVSANGINFMADANFSGGEAADEKQDNPIQGTDAQALYKTERWGEFSYNFNVENGTYNVELHFAEVYWNIPNQRVFSVDVEGSRVVNNLDLVAAVGVNRAHVVTASDIEVTDGQLNIMFSASTDSAKVSALAVFKASGGMTPPSPTPTMIPSPTGEPMYNGQELYTKHGCVACHGNDGQQKSQPIVFANYTYESILKKIDETMPPPPGFDPDACNGKCAEALAEYTWSLRPQQSCDAPEALPRRVRLLTKFEYINTLNDLFNRNDMSSIASGISGDTVVRGFDNNASVNKITVTHMEAYWNAAKSVVSEVDASPWLNTESCSSNEVSYCFAEKFGRQAFRRDLTNEEKDTYKSLFAEGSDDAEGARHVIQSMLVSPSFLYRTELGQGGNLTQYEIATLLSYTFWGTTPDSTLLDKAENNMLSNVDAIKQEVNRLVSSPKAEKQFVHFGRQWLELESVANLDRKPELFPTYNQSIGAAMDEEVDLFLTEIFLRDGYTISDFFNADFVFANNELANFYGLSGATSNDMAKINAGNQRGGVLKLGAVLAANSKFEESNPIKRGLLVRSHLLCQQFGTPPANVGEVEPFDPSKPTRERFAAHTKNEACASCHQYIDEIGFAFENYDAVGKFRALEANGKDVDASGSISGLNKMTGGDVHDFLNLDDLSTILATDGADATSGCLIETFQRMMNGIADSDTCAVQDLSTRWSSSSSIKDLWVEMVASQAFSARQ